MNLFEAALAIKHFYEAAEIFFTTQLKSDLKTTVAALFAAFIFGWIVRILWRIDSSKPASEAKTAIETQRKGRSRRPSRTSSMPQPSSLSGARQQGIGGAARKRVTNIELRRFFRQAPSRKIKGGIGELASVYICERLIGGQVLDAKLPGNTGFDVVFLERGSLATRSKSFTIVESKANGAKLKGDQMTWGWVDRTLSRMINSGDTRLRKLGEDLRTARQASRLRRRLDEVNTETGEVVCYSIRDQSDAGDLCLIPSGKYDLSDLINELHTHAATVGSDS